MAKETGLSRSALVEEIVSGAIAVASPSAKTTIALKAIQTQEQAEEIEINVISDTQELSDRSSRQSQEEEDRIIAKLKNELAQIQQQIAQKEQQLSDVQNQLNKQKLLNARQTKIARSLQKKIKTQEKHNFDLQDRLKEQQSFLSQHNKIEQSLQDELEQKSMRVDELQQERETFQAQCILPDDAQRLIQKQVNQIDLLQQEITNLQRLASFGEKQVNKWRYRTFSR